MNPRTPHQLIAEHTPTPPATGQPTNSPQGADLTSSGERHRRRSPASRRGRARIGAGWSPVSEPPLAVYQASTRDIGGLFPLLASEGLPPVGARIGYDALSGGAFHFDPIELVLRNWCANPNMIIFGEPGTGKSSTVAAFLLRMMLFGVRTLISGDVKGEYSPLVRALGYQPIELGRDRNSRINALDLGPLAAHWDGWPASRQRDEITALLGRWVTLLVALAEAQGYQPTVTDEAVLTQALRQLVGIADGLTRPRPTTLGVLHDALAHPAEDLWRDARFADRRQFLDTLRPMTDALGNLISGPLAGLFDAETTVTVDWDAPIQSMDLSRIRETRGDQAVAVALTCLGSWAAAATDLRSDGEIRIVVRDEVWRSLRLGPRSVAAIDSELRLSRAEQKIPILVAHKPSDFLSAGAAGSQEVAITKDLLALCSTRVLLGQSTRIAADLADELALTDTEQEVCLGWANERPGRALWKVENHRGLKIQTLLSPTEKAVFDTNVQLRTNGNAFGNSGELAQP